MVPMNCPQNYNQPFYGQKDFGAKVTQDEVRGGLNGGGSGSHVSLMPKNTDFVSTQFWPVVCCQASLNLSFSRNLVELTCPWRG